MKEKNLIPFKPGQSGNPEGRPVGRKNKKTQFIEALEKSSENPEKDLEAIVLKGIEEAKKGNPYFWKMIIDRVYPEEKGANTRTPGELSDKELREGFTEYREEMISRGLEVDRVVIEIIDGNKNPVELEQLSDKDLKNAITRLEEEK
jgi:hypothetical protein